jgi:hypothetical protein
VVLKSSYNGKNDREFCSGSSADSTLIRASISASQKEMTRYCILPDGGTSLEVLLKTLS